MLRQRVRNMPTHLQRVGFNYVVCIIHDKGGLLVSVSYSHKRPYKAGVREPPKEKIQVNEPLYMRYPRS